jgi:hypothetical protein
MHSICQEFSGDKKPKYIDMLARLKDKDSVPMLQQLRAFLAANAGAVRLVGMFGMALIGVSMALKAVGFDFIYQVSAESWLRKLKLPNSAVSRNYDAPLRAALASGDKIAVFISGASEKGATVTLSGTADITNLNLRQNSLIVPRAQQWTSSRPGMQVRSKSS